MDDKHISSNSNQHLPRERTEIIHGDEEATEIVIRGLNGARAMIYACADHKAPSVNVAVPQIRKCWEQINARGIKVRYITEVTAENINHCKEMMRFVELRHLDGIKGNFGVIDKKEYYAASIIHEGKPLPQIIYSNVAGVVEQQQYLLETLWNRATPAKLKIREIEEGIEPEFFEVINDQERANKIVLTLVRSARKEVLILLPSDLSLVRARNSSMLEALAIANNERGVKVRIICPQSSVNSDIINWITSHSSIELTNGRAAQSGMVLVDDSSMFSAEVVKPSADIFSDAIGIAYYSNSKRSIELLKSLFNALWTNVDAVRKLEVHDRLQKEFINVAAHELRTPVQPILGRAEILRTEIESGKYDKKSLLEAVDMIIRNSLRLQRLTDDLLTVSKIDRQVLTLNKTHFDLGEVIEEVTKDIKNQLSILAKGIRITFQPKERIVVYGDKYKIAQVIHNLLSNSIKFTEEGEVSVKTERDPADGSITVTIRDTGVGIDLSLLPRLFQLFATSTAASGYNQSGSGIGLYVTRNIIEAHGGRIRAKNNEEGKGATFTFVLPPQ